MKYTDALKIYNQGKSKWCSPRKGSKDYYDVKKIQAQLGRVTETKAD